MDFLEVITFLWEKHRGKMIGILLGLLFGLAVIFWGFWKAVFVTICILIGFYIGKAIDNKVNFKQFFARIFKED